MATPHATSDMAQFFDFGEASIPENHQKEAEIDPAISTHSAECPAHGNEVKHGCLCHGFQGEVELPADLKEHIAPNESEWNADFSSWLPQYHKPSSPCDYCRSRSLECFIFGVDNHGGCSPCKALFRPCSFVEPEKTQIQNKRTALDTLDSVKEDTAVNFGGLTGKKPMRMLGHVGPIEDDRDGDNAPKKGAAAARFPRAAVKILKDWMVEHIEHPYPTDEAKELLKEQTGLTINQISNWMANTRRRQKARPKRSASPSVRPSTQAINIPPGRTWESLNPFERWKHSPPENEPAPMTAIARAVESFDPPEMESSSGSYLKDNSNDSTGSFSIFKAPSSTSLETGFTQMSSGSHGSHNSAYSYGSRQSLGSLNSLKSKEKRRRRRVITRAPKADANDAPRLFQCTFCTDRFKSKYDWARHEKSLHLSLEKWICAPLGEVIACSSSGRRKCVYCDTLDPTEEHLAAHNHSSCEEKGIESRTFYRKDHLRQHLRLMHGCKMTSSMDSWKSEAQYFKSRCGFCDMNFGKWQDRVDHLAKEFRNGATMKDWKGCRGLDAHVAVHVTNAMPPYLIANESLSPLPFSATNSASMKCYAAAIEQNDLEYLLPTDQRSFNNDFPKNANNTFAQDSWSTLKSAPRNAPQGNAPALSNSQPQSYGTCWEVLTLRLGRAARQQMEQHGRKSVTDTWLQREARSILYDEPDDPWNQTAADNPEWLTLFKKSHGVGTDTQFSRHQHEVYADLDIGPNTLNDNNFASKFACLKTPNDDPVARNLAFECTLSGTINMTRHAHQSRPHSDPASTSTTMAGTPNLPDTVYTKYGTIDQPISELACTKPGGICIGENGELGFAFQNPNKGNVKQDYFLPDSQEQTSVSAGDPLAMSAPNVPLFTAARGGMDKQMQFSDWHQLPDDFHVPVTTANLGTSAPINMNFDASAFEKIQPGDFMETRMDISAGDADFVEGKPEDPQLMQWDENELNFNLDMDLDLNMDTSL